MGNAHVGHDYASITPQFALLSTHITLDDLKAAAAGHERDADKAAENIYEGATSKLRDGKAS